jgi:hypothetical protein
MMIQSAVEYLPETAARLDPVGPRGNAAKDWPEYCSFGTSGASGKSASIKEQIADLAGKGVFQ